MAGHKKKSRVSTQRAKAQNIYLKLMISMNLVAGTSCTLCSTAVAPAGLLFSVCPSLSKFYEVLYLFVGFRVNFSALSFLNSRHFRSIFSPFFLLLRPESGDDVVGGNSCSRFRSNMRRARHQPIRSPNAVTAAKRI